MCNSSIILHRYHTKDKISYGDKKKNHSQKANID